MTEIKPSEPMPSKNFFDKGKKFIASGLAALFIGTGIGCKEDQIQTEKTKAFNQETTQKLENIKNTEKQLAEIQKLNERVNTGNLELDYIIDSEISNSEPIKNIDSKTVFPKAEIGMKISPNEYFSLQEGENFIYGKGKFAFFDRETGDIYHVEGPLNYRGIGDRPLWVASEIIKKDETQPSRYELLMYNDGENPIQILDKATLESKIKENLNPENSGTYNEFDLSTIKALNPNGSYLITAGTSYSLHMTPEGSSVEYYSRSTMKGPGELKKELENRVGIHK